MKQLFASMLALLLFTNSLFSEDIKGFWKTIDDKTGKAQSIIAIYPFQDKYYGRIIATYDDKGKIKESLSNPIEKAPGVKGNPYYIGLDIIWDLKKDNDKFTRGKILDPEQGKVYVAEAWKKNGKLNVRGEILFLYRDQEWLPVKESDLPKEMPKVDLNNLTPRIPEVRKS